MRNSIYGCTPATAKHDCDPSKASRWQASNLRSICQAQLQQKAEGRHSNRQTFMAAHGFNHIPQCALLPLPQGKGWMPCIPLISAHLTHNVVPYEAHPPTQPLAVPLDCAVNVPPTQLLLSPCHPTAAAHTPSLTFFHRAEKFGTKYVDPGQV